MACARSGVAFPKCRSTAKVSPQPLHLSQTFKHLLRAQKSAIQCMPQVTEWWSGCRDMLAQS